MAKAKHSYAVRLEVEGGNRVKATLNSVGESGERSIKKIDRASDRASRGLGTLSDRASALRGRMRLLNGAIAGVVGAAAVGGLASLVKRSIDAGDAIAKTADKLGVGTAALQELRFAANLAGIEQTTLDMALQRFTRRAAEAAKGTGEAKQALADMGIALKDQHGNMRRSEDLLNDVAEAFKNTRDPAERLRLAFKLFDSEGVAMVNMLVGGSAALEAVRQQARDLGIVIDEELLRDAEKAKDQLTILAMVISANVNKAVLEHADAIAGLAERFSESLPTLISWVDTFGKWIGLIEETPEERLAQIEERIAEIDETLQSWFRRALEFDIFGREGPLAKERRELLAELEAIQRDLEAAANKPVPAPTVTPAITSVPGEPDPDTPVLTAEERARRILQIETRLQNQLFQLRHQGADRIRAEHEKLVAEMQHLIAPDASNLGQVERVLNAAAVRDERLAELARREQETAERRASANRRILEGLAAERDALAMTDRQRFVSQAVRRLSAEATEEERQKVEALAGALYDERQAQEARDRARGAIEELEAERTALTQTDRQRFISQALRRLSAEATAAQRDEVRALAGALYDEQQALLARNEVEREANRLRTEGEALARSLRTAQEEYAGELERLRELLDAGAIDQETFARASENAYDRMLDASREWSDGVRRAIRDYLDEATDAAAQFERLTTQALKKSEDAFVEWAMTGKFSAKDLFDTIAEEALRAAYRMAVVQPLNNILGTIFGSILGGLGGGTGVATTSSGTPMIGDFPTPTGPTMFAHGGGVVGVDPIPTRLDDLRAYVTAPHLHGGLAPGEYRAVLQRGEAVLTPGQMRALAPVGAMKPEVKVAVNVRNMAPGTQATADWRREAGGDLTLDIVVEQVEAGMARNIGRGQGVAPTLERRYGLNPAAGAGR